MGTFRALIQRVVIVLEQEANDVDAILAHGEVERLAVVVVRPRGDGSLAISARTVSRSPDAQA